MHIKQHQMELQLQNLKKRLLSLTVTPSIIGDGNVLLDIQVNNDSPVEVPGSDEPGIKTNSIVTKLLVSDGDIVVIGGIKKNTTSNTNSRTPGVSKVPVVLVICLKVKIIVMN